jgi:hypothetical protein
MTSAGEICLHTHRNNRFRGRCPTLASLKTLDIVKRKAYRGPCVYTAPHGRPIPQSSFPFGKMAPVNAAGAVYQLQGSSLRRSVRSLRVVFVVEGSYRSVSWKESCSVAIYNK